MKIYNTDFSKAVGILFSAGLLVAAVGIYDLKYTEPISGRTTIKSAIQPPPMSAVIVKEVSISDVAAVITAIGGLLNVVLILKKGKDK